MEIVRFSFDVGKNSIGWAVLQGMCEDDGPNSRQGGTTRIVTTQAVGARIFSDGRNPQCLSKNESG